MNTHETQIMASALAALRKGEQWSGSMGPVVEEYIRIQLESDDLGLFARYDGEALCTHYRTLPLGFEAR